MGIKLPVEKARFLFKSIDEEGSGSVDYHEFTRKLFPDTDWSQMQSAKAAGEEEDEQSQEVACATSQMTSLSAGDVSSTPAPSTLGKGGLGGGNSAAAASRSKTVQPAAAAAPAAAWQLAARQIAAGPPSAAPTPAAERLPAPCVSTWPHSPRPSQQAAVSPLGKGGLANGVPLAANGHGAPHGSGENGGDPESRLAALEKTAGQCAALLEKLLADREEEVFVAAPQTLGLVLPLLAERARRWDAPPLAD